MTSLNTSPIVRQLPARVHIGPHLSGPLHIATIESLSKVNQAGTRENRISFSDDFTREHSSYRMHIGVAGTAGCF